MIIGVSRRQQSRILKPQTRAVTSSGNLSQNPETHPMPFLSTSVVHNLLQVTDYSRVLLTCELSSPNILQKFVR